MSSQSRLDARFQRQNRDSIIIAANRPILIAIFAGALPLLGGCGWFAADADREVYKLIQQRQLAALGQATDVRLNDEAIDIGSAGDPYAFVPHPVTTDVPAEFKTAPPEPAPAPDEDPSEQDRAAQPASDEDAAREPDSPSEPLQNNAAEQLDEDPADPALNQESP